ncbi:MAG: hypothetical protein ACO3RT_08200 [Arenicellales bacterium]|jgi:hypothetical protein|nr:hypothetical protein [Gammaproteobacteria bacterium]NDG44281.1 hypothetical protein [Gammaproteobacteria bacterium]
MKPFVFFFFCLALPVIGMAEEMVLTCSENGENQAIIRINLEENTVQHGNNPAVAIYFKDEQHIVWLSDSLAFPIKGLLVMALERQSGLLKLGGLVLGWNGGQRISNNEVQCFKSL